MKFAPYMYGLLKFTILQKKIENVVPFQNGGQITDFYFVSLLNEIWLKVGEHKYIYITEITFEKNYSVLKWWPKQFFDIAQ